MRFKAVLQFGASLLLTNASVGGPAGAPHYPDLITLPPLHIGIEYNPGTGRKLLRFSNAAANLGEGPLELDPVNSPANGTTDAYQRIYTHDTNGRWYAVATNYVGTFVFHPQHNHWHFENFARYELHGVSADGSVGGDVFASAEKVSFCLVDSALLDPVLEHNSSQTYTNCTPVLPQGISVGWVDVYPWTLPDQYLDITGLPDGDYWLVSSVDPANLIQEGGGAAEYNNTSAEKVRLASDLVWVDDIVPAGAATGVAGGDSWKWISANPAPYSGSLAHQSATKAGMHQHFFTGATGMLAVNTNNTLITYVYLDPANLPGEIMLQWLDLTNAEHRAYWGTNGISLGTDGTPSRRYMGPLPPAGQWVRLEVPASLVGLEGAMLRGMYFTLYDGRAAWDYSGVSVAPPSSGTAPPPIATTAVPPILTAFTPSPLGISIGLADGTTQIKPDSVKLTLDGVDVQPYLGRTGAVTTIKFETTSSLASGSSHMARLQFTDTATPPVTQSYALDFVLPDYALVPAAFATDPGAVDKTKPGFKIRPYETAANSPDRLTWTEDQLAGLKGPNLANLTGADPSGYFSQEAVINFDLGAGAGNFPDDEPFPGLPGTGTRDGGDGNAAIEVLTYLDVPNPGLYWMGVNSEDGFRVTTGANALDKFSLTLGQFDGARSPADTLFRVLVPQAGIYPFRLIWESSSGSANLEWFTVTNGYKVLVNDTTTPGSIRAFREGGTRPYVKAVRPRPGSIDAPATNGIEIAIADGTLPVQGDGIRLFLNDQPVDPLVNKVGGTTTVTYTPRAGLAPESTNVVRLIYEDTAAPAHVMTNEFSFVVAPDYDLLVGIDPASIWRYHASALDPGVAWKETSYDDSSWPSGAALFEGKSGTVPDLPEPVGTALTIDSTITAYYFRTHFAFAGNPGGARLRMRHIIDDGAVFYLNGTEIYRVGMSVGAVTISTLADRSVGNADYEGPVDLPARSLVAGDNVLAVEVHQASSTSSDATMGVQLISITSNPLRTTIASVSPAPGAADVPPDSAIEIVLGDGTQRVEPGSIQLFVNDQPVTLAVNKPAGSPWTTIRYQPAQFLPENTPITVKLVFNDDATPPIVTTREFSFTTAPEITALIAIDDKQLWRYNDTGQDPGPMWKEPGFDDSSWKSGAALFEGKKGTVPALPEPVRTMLTVATNKTAFYFRTHFTFTGDPAATQLKIRSIIDDGAVFYLNGAEVFRLGMPEGPINASTLASRSLVDADYEGPFDVPSSPLRAGDNVLAVEVHQTSPTSSDITMGVQLMVPGVPPAELPAFSRVSLVGTNLQIEWLGSGQLQSADAVTGPWTNVMNAASPFTAAAVGAAKFYRLRQ